MTLSSRKAQAKRQHDRAMAWEDRNYAERKQTYLEIMRFVADILSRPMGADAPRPAQSVEELRDLSASVFAFASDEVAGLYTSWSNAVGAFRDNEWTGEDLQERMVERGKDL